MHRLDPSACDIVEEVAGEEGRRQQGYERQHAAASQDRPDRKLLRARAQVSHPGKAHKQDQGEAFQHVQDVLEAEAFPPEKVVAHCCTRQTQVPEQGPQECFSEPHGSAKWILSDGTRGYKRQTGIQDSSSQRRPWAARGLSS